MGILKTYCIILSVLECSDARVRRGGGGRASESVGGVETRAQEGLKSPVSVERAWWNDVLPLAPPALGQLVQTHAPLAIASNVTQESPSLSSLPLRRCRQTSSTLKSLWFSELLKARHEQEFSGEHQRYTFFPEAERYLGSLLPR